MIATGTEGKEPGFAPQVLAPPPAYGQVPPQSPQYGYGYTPPTPHVGTPPTPQVGTPMGEYRAPHPASEAARLGEQYRAELLAACATGRHDPKTSYGVCGIITAVICFPIGLIALCIDTEERCARCGIRL